MKDTHFKWFANRALCAGKMFPGATVIAFAVLLPGMATAEPGVVGDTAGKEIVFGQMNSETVALRSQPLNFDIASGAPEEEFAAVGEPEAATPALAKLVPDSYRPVSATKEQSTVSAAAPESLSAANDELPQVPYALILALLALISVVPMSRRPH